MPQEIAQLILQPGALGMAGAQPSPAAVRRGRRDVGPEALDFDLGIARQPLLQSFREAEKGGRVNLLLIAAGNACQLAADRPPEERRRLVEQQPPQRLAGGGGALQSGCAQTGEQRICHRRAHAATVRRASAEAP